MDPDHRRDLLPLLKLPQSYFSSPLRPSPDSSGEPTAQRGLAADSRFSAGERAIAAAPYQVFPLSFFSGQEAKWNFEQAGIV